MGCGRLPARPGARTRRGAGTFPGSATARLYMQECPPAPQPRGGACAGICICGALGSQHPWLRQARGKARGALVPAWARQAAHPPSPRELGGRASANEDAGLCIGGAARLFPPIAWGSPGISHACPFGRGLLKEGCPSDNRWGPPTDLDVLASGLSAHGMGTLVLRDSDGLLGCQPAGTWMQWPGDAGSSPG